MKIGQDVSSKIDQKPLRKAKEEKKSFEHIVRSKSQRIRQEELEKLKQDITKQGEKIAHFRSFRDLATFKRMIKKFLKKTIYNGLSLHEVRSFHPESYTHTLTTVKEIDEKVIELTEDIIDQEKKTVDLLETTGEIKGLLFNLST